jgi:hypothetical protein
VKARVETLQIHNNSDSAYAYAAGRWDSVVRADPRGNEVIQPLLDLKGGINTELLGG